MCSHNVVCVVNYVLICCCCFCKKRSEQLQRYKCMILYNHNTEYCSIINSFIMNICTNSKKYINNIKFN